MGDPSFRAGVTDARIVSSPNTNGVDWEADEAILARGQEARLPPGSRLRPNREEGQETHIQLDPPAKRPFIIPTHCRSFQQRRLRQPLHKRRLRKAARGRQRATGEGRQSTDAGRADMIPRDDPPFPTMVIGSLPPCTTTPLGLGPQIDVTVRFVGHCVYSV